MVHSFFKETKDGNTFVYGSFGEYLTPKKIQDIQTILNNALVTYKRLGISETDIENQNDAVFSDMGGCCGKQKNKKTPKCNLYLIRNKNNNCLKIGISKNANQRLKHLSTSTADDLELLFEIKNASHLEKKLHSKFSRFHKKLEWFEYDDEIVNEFKILENEI